MATEETTSEPTLEQRVPAAVLRTWLAKVPGDREDAIEGLAATLLEAPGARRLAPTIFAVTPAAGDPGIYDTAVQWGRHLLTAARRGTSPSFAGAELRLLISPAELVLRGDRIVAVDDPLADDLERHPPSLQANTVHVTGWSAHMLENPVVLDSLGTYTSPSGRSLPIHRIEGPKYGAPPWRNPELLNQTVPYIKRSSLSADLDDYIHAPAGCVLGPPGVGKTRLVWETLRSRRVQWLWLHGRAKRRHAPSLPWQIAQQLLAPANEEAEHPPTPRIEDPGEVERARKELQRWRGVPASSADPRMAEWVMSILDRQFRTAHEPIYLVCDDVEQCHAEDQAFLSQLTRTPGMGSTFRLLLVGRGGGNALPHFRNVPAFRVPPFDETSMAAFTEYLFEQLSLPPATRERYLAATGGYPFAFEEGLVALLRGKSLRRAFRNLTIVATDTNQYRPSPRLICHIVSEVARVGPSLPFLLLAASEPSRVNEVAAASERIGPPVPKDWHREALNQGLLTADREGREIRFACRAYARAMQSTLPPESMQIIAAPVGEILAARGDGSNSAWRAYQLLQGKPEAIPALLEAATKSGPDAPQESEIAEALLQELQSHRDREGDPSTELLLLWRLVPLLRSQGQLHLHASDLARALELTAEEPKMHLALASVKAEMDQAAGRYQEAEDTIHRALSLAGGEEEPRRARLMVQLGRLFLAEERLAEADDLFRNLRQALEGGSDPSLAATCLFYRGNIALAQNRLDPAKRLHEEALEERREIGIPRPVGLSLDALGTVFLRIGDYSRSLDYYREARTIIEDSGDEADLSQVLLGAGHALARMGDYTFAAPLLRKSLTLREGRDDLAGEAVARLWVAKNAFALGQLEVALTEARQAHFQLRLLSMGAALADAEYLLGRVRLRQRQNREALQYLKSALEKHQAQRNREAEAFDVAGLLELGLLERNLPEVIERAESLSDIIKECPNLDMAERLHFVLYKALVWAARHGQNLGPPQRSLERAYTEVMRKAELLEPARRNRFLFQVTSNREIVETASREGLG